MSASASLSSTKTAGDVGILVVFEKVKQTERPEELEETDEKKDKVTMRGKQAG
jgi:hypothetical protein